MVDGSTGQGMVLGVAGSASAGHVGKGVSGQQSMLKVTGLGQLARLIELGCIVGLNNPSHHAGTAPRQVTVGHPWVAEAAQTVVGVLMALLRRSLSSNLVWWRVQQPRPALAGD